MEDTNIHGIIPDDMFGERFDPGFRGCPEISEPEPLYLEVRDETSREGYYIEEDQSSSRDELERQVIAELLDQGEFSEHAGELNTLVMELKNAIATKDTGTLNAFDRRIRDLSRVIRNKPKQVD